MFIKQKEREDNQMEKDFKFPTLEQDKINFSSKSKQSLFETYRMLSDIISKRMYVQYRFNNILEYDDIKQLADLSLWKLLDKYNPQLNTTFSSFAWSKLSNLIRDEIRVITKSRNIGRELENNKLSINDDNMSLTIIDNNNYEEKEGRLIKAIETMLDKSSFNERVKNIFKQCVLYNVPQIKIAEQYKISESAISIHVRKVKRYLQQQKEYLEY